MSKKYLIILSVIVLVVVVSGAFYGGMIYGKNQNKTPLASGNFSAMRAGRTAGNFILGDIISSDSNSITLQLPSNAGSKIIFYSDATQISKTVMGSAGDLSAGTTINVTGTTNSDGSVTASSIQIRPVGQKPGANQ